MNLYPIPIRDSHEPPETREATEAAIWSELLEELRAARQDRIEALRVLGLKNGGGGGGNGKNGGAKRLLSEGALQIITGVTSFLIVAIFVWGITLDRRMAVLENQQFTDADAAGMEQRMRTERQEYVQVMVDALRREFAAHDNGGG